MLSYITKDIYKPSAPEIVIVSANGKDLKSSDSFICYEPKTTILNKAYKDATIRYKEESSVFNKDPAMQNKYTNFLEYYNSKYKDDAAVLYFMVLYTRVGSEGQMRELLANPILAKYGKISTINRSQAYIKLSALNVKDEQILRITGIEKPTNKEESIVDTYNGATVYYNIEDKDKPKALDVLKQFYSKLRAEGADRGFIGTTIIFNKKAERGAIATYDLNDGYILIGMDKLGSGNYFLQTLAHEYAHRLYYHNLSSKRQLIMDTFLKFYRQDTTNDKLKDIITPLIGKTLKHNKFPSIEITEYLGKTIKFKIPNPKAKDPSQPTYLGYTSNDPGRFLKDIPAVQDQVSKMQQKDISPFPSQYSKTNSSEWFAEIFGYYFNGDRLNAEVEEFLKSLLKGL